MKPLLPDEKSPLKINCRFVVVVEVTEYVVVCVGLTLGVALFGAIKEVSDGTADHVYPVEPPLTDKKVEPPGQIEVGGFNVKLAGSEIITFGKVAVAAGLLLSVTEIVYVPGGSPVKTPFIKLV